MKLLTAANRKALPALYSNEFVADPVAVVKFFSPIGAATWYATEFDGDDSFFGVVDLGIGFPEAGYFSLSELTSIVLPLGLKIERDMHFSPTPLSELRAL